ncbi:hypothetical protein FSW04_11155 [Baekduia soli]|uniref:Uncharacterized protein n=1 Tax=Baekduia soli TaxID=496014 RepID=A0A5B8U4X1_9ACTN|nr:hypothetical protein [Baekduia soli]QEC48070.1 hypothetical protein FSW04_11155 [Baekduia soli]
MADRMLFIGWGAPVRGREERSLEVFNASMGLYGRLQQEGRIEGFDVALMTPNAELGGFIQLHGTAAQLAAVREDPEFQRMTVDAELCVDGMRLIDGFTNGGVAEQMALYTEAVAMVPQAT